MPRDLSSLEEDALSGMQPLNRAGEDASEHRDDKPSGFTAGDAPIDAEDEDNLIQAISNSHGPSKRDELHPYTQTLTLNDVESCTLLEEAAFPPQERATREKFQYRLAKCPELSLGIFTSLSDSDQPTAATSAPVYSGAPSRKSVLLGHIVATMTTNPVVTDNDMHIPSHSDPPNPDYGHKEGGRTVCIHSLAVLPDYQGKGLGKTLMKAYLDRLENQDVADRAALIAHEHLIPFYEKLGFKKEGKSEAQFGGGGWFDMVQELKSDETVEDEYEEY